MQRVLLIPGFFGFANIGRMRYFAHVHRELDAALARHGVQAEVHEVATLPTASLQRRAERTLEVAQAVAQPGDRLHLVGHSTGGLDARLLVAPGSTWAEEAIVHSVRSVVSVACPHRGAPIARFFQKVQGERVLRLLSLLTLHAVRLDTRATEPTRRFVEAVGRAGSLAGLEPGLLDQLCTDVLQDFDHDRRRELASFFQEVWSDRTLLRQLSPEGLAPLQDALREHADVAYASVVLRARQPTERLAALRPSHGLYAMLYRLAGGGSAGLGLRDAFWSSLRGVSVEDNDAIVPTSAQAHGAVLASALGDHLDVLGYFDAPDHAPAHVDWLRSGSSFGPGDFAAVWDAVAVWLAARAVDGTDVA